MCTGSRQLSFFAVPTFPTGWNYLLLLFYSKRCIQAAVTLSPLSLQVYCCMVIKTPSRLVAERAFPLLACYLINCCLHSIRRMSLRGLMIVVQTSGRWCCRLSCGWLLRFCCRDAWFDACWLLCSPALAHGSTTMIVIMTNSIMALRSWPLRWAAEVGVVWAPLRKMVVCERVSNWLLPSSTTRRTNNNPKLTRRYYAITYLCLKTYVICT